MQIPKDQAEAQSASKKTRKSAKAAGKQFKILLSGYGGHGLTAFTLHAPAGVHIRFFDRQRGGVRNATRDAVRAQPYRAGHLSCKARRQP